MRKSGRGVAAVFLLVLLLGLLTAIHCRAAIQEAGQENDAVAERVRMLNELADRESKAPGSSAGEGLADPILPFLLDPANLDPPTREQYYAALRESFAYHIAGLQHRRQVFEWQLFSSKVIFYAVLALVFSGIYFAAVQFHRTPGKKGAGESDERVTELAASIKGIKVRSSVLGVVILTISLAFFYLYLVYVYPIQEII